MLFGLVLTKIQTPPQMDNNMSQALSMLSVKAASNPKGGASVFVGGHCRDFIYIWRLFRASRVYGIGTAAGQRRSFRDLQAQIEGTENRITVARKRYIESVAAYNKTVLRFPSSIGASLRGKKERPTFSVEQEGIDQPPELDL